MKKIFLVIVLTSLAFNSKAAKYLVQINVEDFDKIKNQIYVSITGFENNPFESNAIKDSILLSSNEIRELKYPNKFNSIQLTAYVIGSDNKPIYTFQNAYSLNGFKEPPQANPIPISFYEGISEDLKTKSVEQFSNLLKNLILDETTEPLLNDNKVKNDNKLPLGALLFVNEVDNTTLRYDLDLNVDTYDSVIFDNTKLNQHEMIDISSQTSAGVSLNLTGIYSALDFSLQNTKFIEYELFAKDYKKVSIKNFSDEIFNLLTSDNPDKYFQTIFEILANVEEENLYKYKLHLVSSIYILDTIRMTNKSYKYFETDSKLDLESVAFLKLGANNRYYANKEFETSFEKYNAYIDYETTDFSSALYSQIKKYKKGTKKADFKKYSDFYQKLSATNIEKFNKIFKGYITARQLNGLFIDLNDYESNSSGFLTITPSKYPTTDKPSEIEMNKVNIINGWHSQLNFLYSSISRSDELYFTFNARYEGIEIKPEDLDKFIKTRRISNNILASNISK